MSGPGHPVELAVAMTRWATMHREPGEGLKTGAGRGESSTGDLQGRTNRRSGATGADRGIAARSPASGANSLSIPKSEELLEIDQLGQFEVRDHGPVAVARGKR